MAGIVIKANRTLAFLGRNLKICTTKTMDLSYRSLDRPLLEYANTVWDPATKKDISPVKAVQRRAARFVLPRYHCTSI